MTDAQAALARLHGAVRLLSSPQYDEAMTMVAVGDLKGILAHVEAQKAEIKRLRKLAMSTHLFEEAPCFLCGYSGPGYYQQEQHPCAALYHEAREEQHER